MKSSALSTPIVIAVIGGGISGLAAAHRLWERRDEFGGTAIKLVLLEASDRTGGIVRTYRRDGFLLEGGPDSFIAEKPEGMALARRIGLSAHLIGTAETERRSFIVRGGRLRAVPEGFHLLAPSLLWPFLASGIISWRGKARMALDLLIPRRPEADGSDSDESLADFVRRRLGHEALARIAQPMIGGIYTADPEKLSLKATMPRFHAMEKEHGSLIRAMWKTRPYARTREASGNGTSGARYGLFVSLDGGMQMLTDRLAGILPPGTIRTASTVTALEMERGTGRWLVQVNSRQAIAADAVCIATPADRAARLIRGLDAGLAAELDAIPLASTATVNLAYRRADISHPLNGFGFVVPLVERRTTMACTFSSVKFPGRAPGGHVLLRAFVGGALQPDAFARDDRDMASAVQRDLAELIGATAPPSFTQVERWPRSMPQYHVGHLDRIKRIRTRLSRLDRLELAGNAYEGAGIPDSIKSGERAADNLLTQCAVSTGRNIEGSGEIASA